MGEKLVRLLPPGTHDPGLFIRPVELKRMLEANGFVVGRFAGFGPRSLTRRLDVVFGPSVTTAVQYLGSAERAEG